jgi:hypothetical protein
LDQNNKLPKFLYRYFSKAKYAECILRHNELYFRNPDTFNDPFDCKPLLTLERDFNEDEYAKFVSAECPDDGKRQLCEKLARQKYHVIDKKRLAIEINTTVKEGLEQSINEFRVLCLSETYNDILLWSHYADGHHGFVLQFDREALSENFKPCQLTRVFHPPERSYPSIRDYNERNCTNMFLIAKSSQWTYEQEWRVLKQRDVGDNPDEELKAYQFKKDLIKGIILGYKMTPQDKMKIEQWRLRYQPEITLYKAVKDERFYNIRTDPKINE